MTNTLKRQIADTDFMDSTAKPWKGKGKSVAAPGTTRPRTSHHDQQEKVFGNFRLKRILRENHGYDINQLSLFFNTSRLDRPLRSDLNKYGAIREQNDTSNILASVGGAQVIDRDWKPEADFWLMVSFYIGQHIRQRAYWGSFGHYIKL